MLYIDFSSLKDRIICFMFGVCRARLCGTPEGGCYEMVLAVESKGAKKRFRDKKAGSVIEGHPGQLRASALSTLQKEIY
jgi:hypothetical protein